MRQLGRRRGRGRRRVHDCAVRRTDGAFVAPGQRNIKQCNLECPRQVRNSRAQLSRQPYRPARSPARRRRGSDVLLRQLCDRARQSTPAGNERCGRAPALVPGCRRDRRHEHLDDALRGRARLPARAVVVVRACSNGPVAGPGARNRRGGMVGVQPIDRKAVARRARHGPRHRRHALSRHVGRAFPRGLRLEPAPDRPFRRARNPVRNRGARGFRALVGAFRRCRLSVPPDSRDLPPALHRHGRRNHPS